jgi:hypothetical protein
MRNQTVVEVQVVREPMHQDDRRFFSRVVSNVDAVRMPLDESVVVDHDVIRKGSRDVAALAQWR